MAGGVQFSVSRRFRMRQQSSLAADQSASTDRATLGKQLTCQTPARTPSVTAGSTQFCRVAWCFLV